jgi:hypothetical protein
MPGDKGAREAGRVLQKCKIIKCTMSLKEMLCVHSVGRIQPLLCTKKVCVALDNVGLSLGVGPNRCRPWFKSRKREISTKYGQPVKGQTRFLLHSARQYHDI